MPVISELKTENGDEDSKFQLVIDMIDDSIEANQDANERAKYRRDLHDNRQWTDDEKKVLDKRKEACITDNVLKDKVDTFIGIEQKLRTDPKGYPRNPDDEKAAEAATKALRYVADKNLLDEVVTDNFKSMLIEGTEVYEIIVDDEPGKDGNPDIEVVDVMWDRSILDPYSRRTDYNDSRFIGQMMWMDLAQAREEYPDHVDNLAGLDDIDWEGYYEDQPERWYSQKRKRVLIFQLYYKRGGDVWYCEGTRGGFIAEPQKSAYLDENGKTLWPYVVQSSWVTQDGERIGEIERYIDMQLNLNKRLSKLLHNLNKNQVIYERSMIRDPARFKVEINKPDGMAEIEDGQGDRYFQLNNNMDVSQGQFQVLQLAHQRFDQIGPNAALAGEQSGSGRSLQIQQEAGTTKLGPVFGAHDRAKKRVCKAIWHRIKQFWTQEKWVRVTDDSGKPEHIAINTPRQEKDVFGQAVPVLGPDGQPEIENSMGDLDLDIIVDDAPDVINLQAEQFEGIIRLVESGHVQMPPDALIEMSQVPNKERVLEMMKGGGENADPQAQALAQVQQQIQEMQTQLALQNMQLENQKLQAGNALLQAQVSETEAQTRERLAKAGQLEQETGAVQRLIG